MVKENIYSDHINIIKGSHKRPANWPNEWENYDNDLVSSSIVKCNRDPRKTPPTMMTNVQISGLNGKIEVSLRTLKSIVAWAEKKEYKLSD